MSKSIVSGAIDEFHSESSIRPKRPWLDKTDHKDRFKNSVDGQTTCFCPRCEARTRKRIYTITGPFTKDQIESLAAKMNSQKRHSPVIEAFPRRSGSPVFNSGGFLAPLRWLVSPYAAGRSDKYYLIEISAICTNERCTKFDKAFSLEECTVYRRFGRLGFNWNTSKAYCRLGVIIKSPA